MLSVLCAFTILAAAWLFTMYLILRHPGFEWRAAQAAGIVAVSVTTLAAVHAARPAAWLRATAAAGAIALFAVGTGAIAANHAAGADFDGFADVIGLALAAQSALTLLWLVRRLGRLRKAEA